MTKPELLAPAGDLEKLKIALMYGADAVYASTPKFSMRTREIGFDYDSLKEGIDYTHNLGKKVYLTLNVFPHPNEIDDLKEHIKKAVSLKPDAFIIADPGVIEYVKSQTEIPIHLSTQANATNQLALEFWKKQGIERVVLARELSIEEIKTIHNSLKSHPEANIGAEGSRRQPHLDIASLDSSLQDTIAQNDKSKFTKEFLAIDQSRNVQLEAFIHGAMCMAYSGRCQISNYMAGRDPNRGACIQACRYKYKFKECSINEELRPNEDFRIYEDDHGTYLLNSKDLCMIEYLPELIDAGISSFKIEGRLKSIYYVGTVIRAYRKAIDLYFEDPKKYDQTKSDLKKELEKVSNRLYTTGFFFGKPNEETNNYESSKPKSEWGFIGLILGYDAKKKTAKVEVKNFLKLGSVGEIVTTNEIIPYTFTEMMIEDKKVDVVHANSVIEIPLEHQVEKFNFIRIRAH